MNLNPPIPLSSTAQVVAYLKDAGVPSHEAHKWFVVVVHPNGAMLLETWHHETVPAPTAGQLAAYDPDINPYVPGAVSRMQLRLSLLADGVTPTDVSTLIDQAILDPIENAMAHVAWNDATEYQRFHPLILQLAPSLGYDTEAKIDTVFIRAAAYA